MWELTNKLEAYAKRHLGYQPGGQTMLAKIRRDLSDRIAAKAAVDRLKST